MSSEHGQQAVCTCLLGAAVKMSVRTTNGEACETAARAACRTALGTAMGATTVLALGTGRTMWAG